MEFVVFSHFVPEYMAKGIWVKLLKGKSSPMEDALLETWEGQFENVADHTDDAKTLFFVELMHADFKIDLKIGEENEKIEVIRWQFPLLHGMLRTAYSAQGLTLDGGVLVDLRRAGGLEDDDWWLAIYVMLTRARKLENLILLGVTDQVEDLLRRGPPSYLRELTDKLEAKGASTLERLQNWPLYDSVQTSWHHTLHLDSTACRRSDLLEQEMVERSGGLLTCLMPSVYPTDMLTGGILTWFGMFGAENASSDALQCICIYICISI